VNNTAENHTQSTPNDFISGSRGKEEERRRQDDRGAAERRAAEKGEKRRREEEGVERMDGKINSCSPDCMCWCEHATQSSINKKKIELY